jgi:hypothetical protein
MPKGSQPDSETACAKKCYGQTPLTRENQNRNAKKQSIPHNDVWLPCHLWAAFDFFRKAAYAFKHKGVTAMKKSKWKPLLLSLILPFAVGGLSSFLTRGRTMLFQTLNQPSLSPPGWLFPIVWTILYF